MRLFSSMIDILLSIFGSLLATGIISLFSFLVLRTKFNRCYKKAKFHLKRSHALEKARQYDDAFREIEKSIVILEENQNHKLLLEAYVHIGDIACKLKNWDSSIRYYTLCKESASNLKHSIDPDVLYFKLGIAFIGADLMDDAFICIDQARVIQEKINNHPLLAQTYSRLGEIEWNRGHLEIAIEHFLRAINCQEIIRDRRSQAATRTSIGDIYMEKNNIQESIQHYRIAIDLFQDAGDYSISKLLASKVNDLLASGNETNKVTL